MDFKIDDGMPGSGTLLAYKNDFAHVFLAKEKDIIKTCYDGKVVDVDKAHYLDSSNKKYGCNIIRVMKSL